MVRDAERVIRPYLPYIERAGQAAQTAARWAEEQRRRPPEVVVVSEPPPLAEDQPTVDESAYRPAARCLDTTRVKSPKALWKALKNNPWIRWYKPSPQRLLVHFGDWDRYRELLDRIGFDSLDEAGRKALSDVTAESPHLFEEEALRRLEETRRRKFGK
jgi:hypothetical protein